MESMRWAFILFKYFAPCLAFLIHVAGRACFRPVSPISSNWAPRQREPRAAPSNQRKLHYQSKLHVISASAGPIVFQGALRDQNAYQFYSNGLSKYSINSLYYHHRSTPKPCFTTGVSHSNCFQGQMRT